MAEYLVIYRQEGGCDYTIDCGTKVVRLSAASLKAATEAALDEKNLPADLENLGSIDVYEIANREMVDLTSIIREQEAKQKEAEAQHQRNQELKQLEVLAKRYGKKLTDC